MAVGSFPDQAYDPSKATPTGNQFYPPQNDPNVTVLPPKRAELTTANLWEAIKMTKLEDLSPSKLGQIPCMRTSMLQGIGGGVGFAIIRLLTGKPGISTVFSAFGWFSVAFTGIGGAANLYCNKKRTEEIEMMRLIHERFPERSLANARKRREQAERENVQVADLPPPPKVEVSQPSYISVSDSDGNFLGKMTPAMAELAKSRGANETFTEVKAGSAGSSAVAPVATGLPSNEDGQPEKKSWKTLWM